jgi:hypothetical protein
VSLTSKVNRVLIDLHPRDRVPGLAQELEVPAYIAPWLEDSGRGRAVLLEQFGKKGCASTADAGIFFRAIGWVRVTPELVDVVAGKHQRLSLMFM